jgi:hypothetical protein
MTIDSAAAGEGNNAPSPLSSLRYSEVHSGPFDVLIQANTQDKQLNNLSICKLIWNNTDKALPVSFTNAGRNRIKASFQTFELANVFMDSLSKIKDVIAQIPFSLFYRSGIVRNVPSDFTVEELMQAIQCNARC